MSGPRKRTIALVVGACLAPAACYDMTATRIALRTPFTDLDCRATADAVFDREGFVAAPNVSGARLYTPRAMTAFAHRWGIAVSIEGGGGEDHWGQCKFELQPLSTDEDCGINCPLTPQPGFNDVTRKMARLLHDAFAGRSEK